MIDNRPTTNNCSIQINILRLCHWTVQVLAGRSEHEVLHGHCRELDRPHFNNHQTSGRLCRHTSSGRRRLYGNTTSERSHLYRNTSSDSDCQYRNYSSGKTCLYRNTSSNRSHDAAPANDGRKTLQRTNFGGWLADLWKSRSEDYLPGSIPNVLICTHNHIRIGDRVGPELLCR